MVSGVKARWLFELVVRGLEVSDDRGGRLVYGC